MLLPTTTLHAELNPKNPSSLRFSRRPFSVLLMLLLSHNLKSFSVCSQLSTFGYHQDHVVFQIHCSLEKILPDNREESQVEFGRRCR
jgi:hypothetical protein